MLQFKPGVDPQGQKPELWFALGAVVMMRATMGREDTTVLRFGDVDGVCHYGNHCGLAADIDFTDMDTFARNYLATQVQLALGKDVALVIPLVSYLHVEISHTHSFIFQPQASRQPTTERG